MTPEQASNMGVDPRVYAAIAAQAQQSQQSMPGVTANDLSQLQGNPFAAPLQAPQVSPQDLAAVQSSPVAAQAPGTPSAPGGLPPSDPNGFTTPTPQPADTMGAGQDPNTANAGAPGVTGNAASNQFNPGGPADQGNTAPPTPAPAAGGKRLAPYAQWVTDQFGGNFVVTPEQKGKLMEAFFKYQEKQLEMATPKFQAEQIKAAADAKKAEHEVTQQPTADAMSAAKLAETKTGLVKSEMEKAANIADLSNKLDDLTQTRDTLGLLANHPAVPAMTGLMGQMHPALTDQERDFAERLKQANAKRMLAGINLIKTDSSGGAGSMRITQAEVMKVMDAAGRLGRGQSAADFTTGANEMIGFYNKGIANLQAQISRLPQPDPQVLAAAGYNPVGAIAPSTSPAPGTSSGATSGAVSGAYSPMPGDVTVTNGPGKPGIYRKGPDGLMRRVKAF